MIPIHNYLIVSAIGVNRPEIISELSRACLQCGCNLLNIQSNLLGHELAITLFLSGNWGAIAKIEATLPSLEQRLELSIHARRTSEPAPAGQWMTYSIQMTAIDKTGILSGISEFLYRQGVTIEEISAHTYLGHTNTRMASLELKVHVPASIHLATFREQLMNYCDSHNLDAFLEPARQS